MTAMIHWQDPYSTVTRSVCNRLALLPLTTSEPDEVTCEKRACQAAVQAERRRRVVFAAEAFGSTASGLVARTPQGSKTATIEIRGEAVYRDFTYEQAVYWAETMRSLAATLHARDRERIEETRVARRLEELKRERGTDAV